MHVVVLLGDFPRPARREGDDERKVDQRLRKAEEEEPVGVALADHVLVNTDLDQTIAEMLQIVRDSRRSASI
ncbi:MAG: hypothetical protein EBW98_02450 [Actinobacteria bacterium]|nr:hypothetical protein [Actinomycetota bacterium]